MIVMASLDPEANAIVEAGRSALQATPSDRERIEALLRARLGAAALPPDPVAKPLTRGVAWRVVPGAAIGVCVLGCALFFALRPRPSAVAARAPQPTASVAAPVATDSSTEQFGAGAAEPTPSAASPSAAVLPSASSLRQEDKLAQEVALLLRATSALSAGRPGEALKALNEHQRRFPRGILSEERRAAKAQAFCSLGRVSEGRAELAHLTPQSPAASRAKQVCDSISTAAPAQ
jgi:hypothetical protein